MKYFLYFSTDLEKLVEGFCLFFLNKNQKKQFLEPTLTNMATINFVNLKLLIT
jgi:hypothetical protein